jgi:peptidoglycan/LPS O-acetylase OafA/YrhL
MNYRPEIDGLRALAILPVIFFHLDFNLFNGGFLGVDIFFVISGYLITYIIIIEIKEKKFSLVLFYERRARRILPALFLIMFFSSIVGYFLMLPDAYQNFGQSLVSTTLFSNNIFSIITSDYWDLTSEFKPLLHTWSLGVEEQYYFLIPLILLIIHNFFEKKISLILVSIFLLSFAISMFGSLNFQRINFYSLPTRAWELMIGSFLVLYQIQDNYKFRNTSFFNFLGILTIFFSIIFLSKENATPGPSTLLPTIGAALIILSQEKKGIIYKILTNRISILVGKMSYSLYLWHWPVLVYFRVYSKDPPLVFAKFILLLVIFILSFLTWKYIETPFRNKNKISKKLIYYLTIIISAIFIGYGYMLHKTNGLQSRIYDNNKINLLKTDISHTYNESANKYKKGKFDKNKKLKVLIIGDSFGRDFINMIKENYNTFNMDIIYQSKFPRCVNNIKKKNDRSIYDNSQIIIFVDTKYNKKCIKNNILLAEDKSKDIFYVGQKDFGYNLNWIARISKQNRGNLYNNVTEKAANVEKEFKQIVPKKNRISIMEKITTNGKILITDGNGNLLTPDRKHLTKYGAKLIGKKVFKDNNLSNLLEKYQ